MRDFGALLWVVLVVVGVVSSIISNARRQSVRSQATPQRPQVSAAAPPSAARPAPQPPRRQPAPAQPPATARVVSSPAAASARPDVFVAHEGARPKKSALAHLLHDRRSLVRAIVASEVLGKPRALRDE